MILHYLYFISSSSSSCFFFWDLDIVRSILPWISFFGNFMSCYSRSEVLIIPRTAMDQTANCPASMVPSLPEDGSSMETLSPYLSPVSATATRDGAHPLVGLGISNCSLDPNFDASTGFSYPVSYTTSPNTFPADQLLTPSAFYDVPLKPQDLSSDPTCVSIHNAFSDASLSPLSPYGSQPMSASPSYNSNLEIQCGQDSYPRMTAYWDSKPSSGPPTPMETRTVKGDPISALQRLPGQVQYCAPFKSTYLSTNAGLPYKVPYMEDSDRDARKLQASSRQMDPSTSINSSSEVGTMPMSKPPQRPRTASAGERIAAGKGFSCSVCGFTFTRKSNCKEHEKKHDPSSRRYFPCSECSKAFGRNADLKRHVDNVRPIDLALP